MNDLLSIIIPVFNQEKNLKRCLDSIINQTYRNLEVILIDDGSTDHSFSICRDYSERFGWIVIHVENGGVSNARNIGLDRATGKYVLFIDSDDYISNNYVEALYRVVKNGDCSIAYSKCVEVLGSAFTEIDDSSLTSHIIDISREFDYGKSYMLRHVHSSIFSRNIIGSTRFIQDIHVGEDAYFVSQIITKSNYKVAYTTEATYFYVIYDLSSIHGPIDERKMTVITAWKMIIDNYQEHMASLVPGCYSSLFQEIESLVCRLIIDGPFNRKYYYGCVRALRNNCKGLLNSTSRTKTKIKYLWFILLPKSYVRLVLRKRK